MRLGILVITISSLTLVACNKTTYQFGNTVPAPTSSTHNDLGNVQENTPMNIIAPLSENNPNNETLPSEPKKIVQPNKLKPAINSTANNTVTNNIEPAAPITIPAPEQIARPAPTNWQPNEALIIRGNELLSGLQREIGKKPTVNEMQKRLQTHMGLSAPQAQQLLGVLGLT